MRHSWTGPAARAPLLALHGFTGDGRDIDPLVPLLGRAGQAPDLPGHGDHPAREPAACAMPVAVADLLPCLASAPIVLGYSMGGRVALHLACHHPGRVAALVLVGAQPGIADDAARAARQAADEALAARILEEGVPAFTAWWAQQPLIATQRRIAEPWRSRMAGRKRSLRPEGLAASLRGMGTGVMDPLWDRLGAITAPTLLVTGAEDEKYDRIAAQMAAAIPGAERLVLPGAGHCAHLEAPRAFAGGLTRFLTRQGLD
ncbi:MAG: alpha/beta fold hydrolase [Alphaproteobacteria bacterium]|nr:alpha/beta fold hydrolase [Alphaproteobacteria bacterium]